MKEKKLTKEDLNYSETAHRKQRYYRTSLVYPWCWVRFSHL